MVRARDFLFSFASVRFAAAATKEYNWEASWVWGAPGGVGRPIIGANGVWPWPTIRASVGDTVKVHLTNNLGNQTTGIHWHGISQTSTIWADGPSLVTQCPLPPNMTMTYQFVVDAPGTFWYHSHNMGQYPDGMRGALIVDDPNDPYTGKYDEEHIITVSDWYNEQSVNIVRSFLSPDNPDGRLPEPDAALINDGLSAEYEFNPSKTYRLRLMSYSTHSAFMIQAYQHPFTVIMADSVYTDSPVVDQLRMTPGQRYDVLIHGSDAEPGNFPMLFSLDVNQDWTLEGQGEPAHWPHNVTAFFVSDPNAEKLEMTVYGWDPEDDAFWHTRNRTPRLPDADHTFVMEFSLCLDDYGIPRQCINGQTYVEQKVPTLYTAATVGDANSEAIVYGKVNPYIVRGGDIIDIVVNNVERGIHPFHMHGYNFQILARPPSGSKTWPGAGQVQYHDNPLQRDTVSVMSDSYLVVRIRATNAGVYLFHCHLEWHVEMGLTSTFIIAPETLINMTIPEDHKAACDALGIPTAGNAGGNTEDVFDTSNYNDAPPEEYDGAMV